MPAWVQAWIDGRWRSYDAALRGFDSGYITLGIYDGNKKDFLDILQTLHQISVTSVARVNYQNK